MIEEIKKNLCKECRRKKVVEFLNREFKKFGGPLIDNVFILHINGKDVFGLDYD